jgi:sialic acid synthase SpsE
MPAWLDIGGRRIGTGQPLFVVAEIGLNHGGSLDRAMRLVDCAADGGASAVKLQTLLADELVAADCPAPAHVQTSSLRRFFARFELDERAHRAIVDRARARGLAVMATPFSRHAVDLLERVDVDAYKIASGDLTYLGLIEYCARTGKPVILSTGMAQLPEIAQAIAAVWTSGGRNVALLHCVSAYPVPHGSENLRGIATLLRAFDLPVGLSDHAPDASAVPIAVTLGASIYERHVMLDDDDDGAAVDAAVSSTSAELTSIVRVAADTLVALGDGRKECLAAEAMNLVPSRRALRATRPLLAGHVVGPDDVTALRPADGLSASFERLLFGVRLARDIEEGAPFVERDLPAMRGQREAA